VKFLADNGADLQAKDASGRTALDLAKASREPLRETVALLESLLAAKAIR
jgi:ankyrin repeat protein